MAPRAKKVVVVPREGARHPAFDDLSKKDAVQLLLRFEQRKVAPRKQQTLVAQVQRWATSTDWHAAGGQAAFAPIELGPDCATVTFIGTTRPAAAIDALLQELRASPQPLREAVIMRRRVGRGSKLGAVLGPALPKQRGYKSEGAWWRASFDPKATPPLTEDPAGMFSVVQSESGDRLMELRPVALALPGVRIVYGLADGIDYPRPSQRAVEVTKVVTTALRDAFGGASPRLYNADAQPGRPFERIAKDDRRGYVFAISREDEMFALYPRCFRYREYELMCGLVDAIGKLRLEPVIHWLRDHCFMVNLWERRAKVC